MRTIIIALLGLMLIVAACTQEAPNTGQPGTEKTTETNTQPTTGANTPTNSESTSTASEIPISDSDLGGDPGLDESDSELDEPVDV